MDGSKTLFKKLLSANQKIWWLKKTILLNDVVCSTIKANSASQPPD
jgi:hypothetical protein